MTLCKTRNISQGDRIWPFSAPWGCGSGYTGSGTDFRKSFDPGLDWKPQIQNMKKNFSFIFFIRIRILFFKDRIRIKINLEGRIHYIYIFLQFPIIIHYLFKRKTNFQDHRNLEVILSLIFLTEFYRGNLKLNCQCTSSMLKEEKVPAPHPFR